MMIINKFLFSLIIINNIKFIISTCSLPNTNTDGRSPIYFQNFENNKFLIPSTGIIPDFDEFSEITLYCPSGFENPWVYVKELYYSTFDIIIPNNEIVLTCLDEQFKINYASIVRNGFYDSNLERHSKMLEQNYISLDGDQKIICKKNFNSGIYEIVSNQKHCNGTLYFNGLNLNNNPLHFADFCFNHNNYELEYFHYVSSEMKSTTLVQQSQFSGVPLDLSKDYADFSTIIIPEKIIENRLIQILGWHASLMKYEYADLLPNNFYMPFFKNPLNNYTYLQKFLGWKNLIDGNWKKFNNLLRIRSITEIYDVYTGTSGVTTLPLETNYFKELFIEYGDEIQYIPKYIWAYLKAQNSSEEFVVIGINSPSIDNFGKSNQNICEDICDEILWLDPMKEIRKISTFGFIFCCNVTDVSDTLHGFPNLRQESNLLESKEDEKEQLLEIASDL